VLVESALVSLLGGVVGTLTVAVAARTRRSLASPVGLDPHRRGRAGARGSGRPAAGYYRRVARHDSTRSRRSGGE
jgi:hypothetical protein